MSGAHGGVHLHWRTRIKDARAKTVVTPWESVRTGRAAVRDRERDVGARCDVEDEARGSRERSDGVSPSGERRCGKEDRASRSAHSLPPRSDSGCGRADSRPRRRHRGARRRDRRRARSRRGDGGGEPLPERRERLSVNDDRGDRRPERDPGREESRPGSSERSAPRADSHPRRGSGGSERPRLPIVVSRGRARHSPGGDLCSLREFAWSYGGVSRGESGDERLRSRARHVKECAGRGRSG
jgi:hypothetical protein